MKPLQSFISLVFLSGFPTLLYSATSTTTFQVQVNVVSACNVAATNMVFSNYNPLDGSNGTSTNTITVTCTTGTGYSIALNAGLYGTFANRLVQNATTATIQYNIYTTGSYSNVWGDGTGGTSTVSSTGTGSGQPYTGYGRIVYPQAVSSLTNPYQDTITVTVTFT